MTRQFYMILINKLKKLIYLKIYLINKLLLFFSIFSEHHYIIRKLIIIKYKRINLYNTMLYNNCLLSGRTKAISKYLLISRFKKRKYINDGFLIGYKRNSW